MITCLYVMAGPATPTYGIKKVSHKNVVYLKNKLYKLRAQN